MEFEQIKKEVGGSRYDFLRISPTLGKNIVLLGLAGSHAYGTEHPGSDLDIRGIATNTKANITTLRDFEQIVDTGTDTVIYSFDKMMVLFASCNPSEIELLGLKPEHYLYVSDVGHLILNNYNIFLSKVAVNSYGGFIGHMKKKMLSMCESGREKAKIAKHMAHLVRLYYTAFDLFERKQIVTYRDNERSLLMSILHCYFLNEEAKPTEDFYYMIHQLDMRMDYAVSHTTLPDRPDKNSIRAMQEIVNTSVVMNAQRGI